MQDLLLVPSWRAMRSGTDDAGKGELLEENTALHFSMMELDFGQREVIALREFEDEIFGTVLGHKKQCDCEV